MIYRRVEALMNEQIFIQFQLDFIYCCYKIYSVMFCIAIGHFLEETNKCFRSLSAIFQSLFAAHEVKYFGNLPFFWKVCLITCQGTAFDEKLYSLRLLKLTHCHSVFSVYFTCAVIYSFINVSPHVLIKSLTRKNQVSHRLDRTYALHGI